MATIITMPRLSDTMTEGTVATWLKKVGDKVSEGDILDMKTSIVTHAFIQARTVELVDKHKQLYERYKYKYSIK